MCTICLSCCHPEADITSLTATTREEEEKEIRNNTAFDVVVIAPSLIPRPF